MSSARLAITARKRAPASRLTLPALAFAVGASFAPQAYAQNLVVNPGFEIYNPNASPNEFVGWTDPRNAYESANPHTGNNAAGTGIVGSTAPLYQDIALVAGQYQLSFFAYVGGSAASAGRILQVSLGGQQLLNQVNPTTGINAYQFYTFNYTQAAAGLARLEFDIQNNPDETYVDDVSLTLLAALANNLGLNSNLVGLAQTQNQRAVATGLTNAFNNANLGTVTAPNGNAGAIVTALNNTNPAAIPGVLDSLSGEGIAATQNLAHREAGMFTSAIFDQTTFYGAGGGNQIVLTAPTPGSSSGEGFVALAPQDTLKAAAAGKPIRELADLPSARPAFVEAVPVAPTRTWRAWGTGFGANEDIHSNAAIGYAAQMDQIYGGAVGVDYQLAPGTLLGLAAGGSDGEFNVPNRATSGSTTGGHVAGYSLVSFGPAYGAFSASGSFFQNRTTRNVGGFGGLGSETEKGNFSSREVRVRLEAGRGFAAGYGTLTPFVALEIASLRSDGFTEQGIAGPGLFALNVAGQSTADVPAFVGLRYATVTTLGNGMVFKPVIQAAYVHEFAPYRQIFAGIASLPGAVFLVDGARPARDAAQVKAGGELAIGPRSAIFANFDGEFARANQLYGGKGGIKVAF